MDHVGGRSGAPRILGCPGMGAGPAAGSGSCVHDRRVDSGGRRRVRDRSTAVAPGASAGITASRCRARGADLRRRRGSAGSLRRDTRIPMDCASSQRANGTSWTRYRRASRRGSSASRCATPRRSAAGRRGPAELAGRHGKTSAASQHPRVRDRAAAGGRSGFLLREAPVRARTRSGRVASHSCHEVGTCSSSFSKPYGGESVPATRSPGNCSASASPAASGTPGSPPMR